MMTEGFHGTWRGRQKQSPDQLMAGRFTTLSRDWSR